MAWNERALMGVKRFIDRFDRLVDTQAGTRQDTPVEIKALIHKAVDKLGKDLPSFKFNTAVAMLMETLNGIQDHGGAVNPRDLRMLVQAIAPLAPFFADDAWQKLGGNGSVHGSLWPEIDPALLIEDTIEIPVQVNGKLRATLTINRDANQQTAETDARALEAVAKHLEAGTVLQGRELPSVMAAACKALEGAMNIEATALGVAGLLEDLSN